MSEAMRDHLARTGVDPYVLKVMGHTSTLVEHRLNGAATASPYVPFGHRQRGYSVQQQRQEAADWIVDSLAHAQNLQRTVEVRIFPNAKAIKPVLVHELEMERIGASVNPSAYTRNPMEKSAFALPRVGPVVGTYQGDLRF